MWQLYNNQGPTWSFAQTSINERKDFNIIFEGTWGPNRASGSIAIDDVAFYTGNCTGNSNVLNLKENYNLEKPFCNQVEYYSFLTFKNYFFSKTNECNCQARGLQF